MMLIVLVQAVLHWRILEPAALLAVVTKLRDQPVVLLWLLHLKLCAQVFHQQKNSVQPVPVLKQALAKLTVLDVLVILLKVPHVQQMNRHAKQLQKNSVHPVPVINKTLAKLTALDVQVTLMQVKLVKMTVLLLLKLSVRTETKNSVQPGPVLKQTLARLPARLVLGTKSLVIRV